MTADEGRRCKRLTIIGLGNELLSDDGAGIMVVRRLKERLPRSDVAFEELSVGGLQLLDHVTGCDTCVIIDAVVTGEHRAGTIYRFVQSSDHKPVPLTSSHQIDLAQVLSFGAFMGAHLPTTVMVYGIEAGDVTTFWEARTDEVARALPLVVEAICRDLDDCSDSLRIGTGDWQIIHEPLPA